MSGIIIKEIILPLLFLTAILGKQKSTKPDHILVQLGASLLIYLSPVVLVSQSFYFLPHKHFFVLQPLIT